MRAEASCCAGYLSAVTAPELAGICGRLRSGAAPVPGQLVVFEQLVSLPTAHWRRAGEGEGATRECACRSDGGLGVRVHGAERGVR